VKPVIFLAFANDKQHQGQGFLTSLTAERNALREALKPAEEQGLCEVVVEPDVSIERIFDTFQSPKYRDRIALFHFAGHAGSYELLLESAHGSSVKAHSGGLLPFLAEQRGLQLVFINGCSSRQQSEDLIRKGVPAAIGTSRPINDSAAMDLARHFYKAIAAGNPLERSWTEAVQQVNTARGGDTSGASRSLLLPSDEETEGSAFPWELLTGEEHAQAKQWSLPEAARQPLFGLGLPLSYYRNLPPSPYPGLRSFLPSEAAIFFGRGQDIRSLYTLLSGPQPLILLSGKAGAGRSSLLKAGLLPRLGGRYTAAFAACGPAGLLPALHEALAQAEAAAQLPIGSSEASDPRAAALRQAIPLSSGYARELLQRELDKIGPASPGQASFLSRWKQVEAAAGLPLVLALDDVSAQAEDWPRFREVLLALMQDPGQAPAGKLILSCREEEQEALQAEFQAGALPAALYFLPPLSAEGIAEAVEGVALAQRSQSRYRIEVEREGEASLAQLIADDLTEGEQQLAAPVLQVLLSGLWKAALAENPRAPRLSRRLYMEQKFAGQPLSDFFQAQFAAVRSRAEAQAASGLLLDLLYQHISPLGTGQRLRSADLERIYGERAGVAAELARHCEDAYLMASDPGETGLGHNFLAPVVLRAYSSSLWPGQQAARILHGKLADPEEGAKDGRWLSEAELALVEQGREGMRQWTAREAAFIQDSRARAEKQRRERRLNRRIRQGLGISVALFALLAGWQWQVSRQNFLRAYANQLAFEARGILPEDNTLAMRLAWEAYAILKERSSETVSQTLSEVFHSQSFRPFYAAVFRHEETVNSALFSPDGRQVLTASEDGFVRLFTAGGELLEEYAHGIEVADAKFSPNGRQVLTLTRDSVFLWEMGASRADAQPRPEGAPLSNFSTDGLRLIPNYAQAGGKAYAEPPLDSATRAGMAFGLFSPDGAQFLSVSVGDSSQLILWDAAGRQLWGLRYPGQVRQASFSPDGSQLLTASDDGSARRWELRSLWRQALPGHRGAVSALRFFPDGKGLLTASFDGMLRRWDAAGQCLDSLLHGGPVNDAHISPDGTRIASAADDNLARIWLPASGGLIALPHSLPVSQVLFSPAGDLLLTLSLDNQAFLWTADGTRLDSFPFGGIWLAEGMFSRDGRLCIWADSSLSVWRLADRKVLRLSHPMPVLSAVFSPDGRSILSAARDGKLRLWTAEGQLRGVFAHPGLRQAVFSPDGRHVLSVGERVRIWTPRGKALDSLEHAGNIESLSFSADGAYILTASSDHSARLWSREGSLLARYEAHDDIVTQARFSPDGSLIVTASNGIRNNALRWLAPPAVFAQFQPAQFYRLSPEQAESFHLIQPQH
jgi:WD40 repeat protein